VSQSLQRFPESNMLDVAWVSPLAGGVLIGLSASLLLLSHGRVAGISSICAGLWSPRRGDRAWRAWFVAGLLAAGVSAQLVAPQLLAASPRSLGMLAVAGLLVGFGTQLGGGCTSGHGVCGISRLSPRSIVATLTFIASGIAAVAAVHVMGGAS
jgi:uncharacterized membrane protein YedE/YeeE